MRNQIPVSSESDATVRRAVRAACTDHRAARGGNNKYLIWCPERPAGAKRGCPGSLGCPGNSIIARTCMVSAACAAAPRPGGRRGVACSFQHVCTCTSAVEHHLRAPHPLLPLSTIHALSVPSSRPWAARPARTRWAAARTRWAAARTPVPLQAAPLPAVPSGLVTACRPSAVAAGTPICDGC